MAWLSANAQPLELDLFGEGEHLNLVGRKDVSRLDILVRRRRVCLQVRRLVPYRDLSCASLKGRVDPNREQNPADPGGVVFE